MNETHLAFITFFDLKPNLIDDEFCKAVTVSANMFKLLGVLLKGILVFRLKLLEL